MFLRRAFMLRFLSSILLKRTCLFCTEQVNSFLFRNRTFYILPSQHSLFFCSRFIVKATLTLSCSSFRDRVGVTWYYGKLSAHVHCIHFSSECDRKFNQNSIHCTCAENYHDVNTIPKIGTERLYSIPLRTEFAIMPSTLLSKRRQKNYKKRKTKKF